MSAQRVATVARITRPKTRPHVRAFQRIVAAIRDDVFARRLVPGDRLPQEPVLAEQFGVSRLAVREALRVLELQGLVRVEHGFRGGAFVAEISTRPVSHALETLFRLERVDRAELYAARRTLEPPVAALAARDDGRAALAALRENIADAERLVVAGRPAFGTNLAFHELLADACGNRVLRLMTKAVLELLRTVERRVPSDLLVNREACRAHRALLAALEARSAERAERQMRSHLARVARHYGERMREHAR